MSGAILDREWSLLLAACSAIPPAEKTDRVRQFLHSSIHWELLFELAGRHGVQPLLFQAIRSIDGIPPGHLRALQKTYETNLHKALLLSRELIRIVTRLSELGIEVMPYKGPALAEVIYGDIAQRQSGDIDLLIHPQDLPRIRDAVRELGYTPHLILSEAEESAYLKSGYEYAFDGAAGPNLLELQWAIQPRFYAVDFDMKDLFERAIPISVAGQPMKTPSREDLFLVLSAHAAKHIWGRLVWLCDLAQLMSLPTLNWGWIGTQARTLGIERILGVTIGLANRLLGAEVPSAAQKSIAEDRATVLLVEEIQTQITCEASFDVESFAYFRLMLRLREKLTDRIRFVQRLALTPGPGEWNAVRLPRPLFPLYRLVRLTRLAKRFVGA
jgi:Uncharacterised nucleotidyltransferase